MGVARENLPLDLFVLRQVFLRDSQHALLQARLHSEQIHKICVLQRWIKGTLQRKQFIRQRNAAIMIQVTKTFSIFFCIGVISLDLIVLHFAHKRIVRTRCLQSVLANQKACVNDLISGYIKSMT